MMIFRSLSLLIVALMLSACGGGDMSDLELFIENERRKDNFPTDKPLPNFPQSVIAYYEGETLGLRDPFEPLETKRTEVSSDENDPINCPRPDPHRRLEDLESYALDSLEMKGVFTQENDDVYALIEDPQGGLHPIQVGNHLGLNHGEVILIDPEQGYVQLREMIPNEENCFKEQRNTIQMQRRAP